MVLRVGYWLGIGAVAVVAVLAVWLSWRANPVTDPEAMADRFRVLVTVAALVVAPWLGRRREVFGPVADNAVVRVVRLLGCAALCGVMLIMVHQDSLGRKFVIGMYQFSWPRQIAGLVLVTILVSAPFVIRSRWPESEASTIGSVGGICGVCVCTVLPLQVPAILYVAAVYAATSRDSAFTPTTLVVGAIGGLPVPLILNTFVGSLGALGLPQLLFIVVLGTLAAVTLAAVTAGWLVAGTMHAEQTRALRFRQGFLAGLVAGAVCGIVSSLIFVPFLPMMIAGPVLGVVGGALGGAIARTFPRVQRREGYWAGGFQS